MKKNATAAQFEKLILRMMPTTFSSMGEGRLIAAIISNAWADADKYRSARTFFTDPKSALGFYCEKVGLNADQLRELFVQHSAAYKLHVLELAA